MEWRVLAVAAAVLAVLAGGALLAAQTEQELAGEIAQKDLGRFERPDSTPLKPNGFRLPKDIPIEIPEGTKISPDGMSMTIPEDMDLQLPEGLDLSQMDFELPEDFELDLPEGTTLSPPGLDLPQGGEIRLPDGSSFQLPPGSHLDLPQEVIDQLLQQGLRPGELGQDATFDLNDLPPGMRAQIDPPEFTGPGELNLPANTSIRLPDGQVLPFPPGAVFGSAARYLLPAGSEFDIPYGAGLGNGTMPLPGPATPQGAPGTRPIDTEIDSLPQRARKTDPIRAQGHVRDGVSGQPLAGRAVEIYLNDTKATPGVLVGRGVSDARGLFDITVRIPEDRPAREYQLVNRAPGDDVYADGWGDPPLSTFAATNLTLFLPAREGAGARVPVSGALLDETLLPVPDARISVLVDGAIAARATTGADGRFDTSVVFAPGTHAVQARYTGNATYEASEARGTIEIDALALDAPIGLRARPGDAVSFTARLVDNGTAAVGRVVDVELFPGVSQRATTDARGDITIDATVPGDQPPGAHTFTYRVQGAPHFLKTQPIEVFVRAHLAVDQVVATDADRPVELRARLLDERDAPVRAQPMRGSLSGPGGAVDATALSGPDGAFTLRLTTPRAVTGEHALVTGLAAPNRYVELTPDRRSVRLSVFDLDWTVPATAIRGQPVTLAGRAEVDGAPLRGASFRLDAWGARDVRTDDVGAFTLSVDVPRDAALGATDLVLRSDDHADRTARLRLLAVPKLTIEAPEGRPPDAQTVRVTLRLTDDLGAPIPNAPLDVVSRAGRAQSDANATTDAEGYWRGEVAVPTADEEMTILASVLPQGDHLGAQASARVPIGAPPAIPWLALGVAGALVLVGAAAASAAYWLRRRRRPGATQAAMAADLPSGPRDLDVAFALPAGEPPVLGVGETIDVVLTNRGPTGDVRLEWGTGHRGQRLATGESARTTLAFDVEGDVVFSASRDGGSPARATLRVVDYRKEVAREFDALLARSRTLAPELGPRTTARELQWALEGRLGPGAMHALDEVAESVEVTNYSRSTVARADYLRFVRGARALEPLLGGEAA